MSYSYYIPNNFETCRKLLEDDTLVCMLDIVKQNIQTGEIEVISGVIKLPVDLKFFEAIALFEQEKLNYNFEKEQL